MSMQAEFGDDLNADASAEPVQKALAELEAALSLPIEQRVAALENVHRSLAEALDAPPDGEAGVRSAVVGT